MWAGPSATAQIPVASAWQQPGYYRLKIGSVNVTALSDGTVPQPLHELLTNTTPAEVDRLLKRAHMSYPVEASVNAYLLEVGNRLVLVDTGTGDLLGPTLGHLPATLQAAGYRAEQITDILITHIHTDHTGGLMAGSQRVFPNATVHVSQAELDFWLSEASLKAAAAENKKYFLEARSKVSPYVAAGKVQPFTGNVELLPGIRTIASPGHTPGHTFYALESQGQKLVFWGDMMHVAAVQFPKPGVTIVYDVNAKAAAATRARAYAEAAKEGYWVAVDHISFPGIGHVRATGNAYDWVPMNYSTYFTGQ
ncbi:MBL fold metallo-hydrolase [Hymenobacter crusticola]|nr:MBL fold metallo-hydrolase [Hymenobacter crusticola]